MESKESGPRLKKTPVHMVGDQAPRLGPPEYRPVNSGGAKPPKGPGEQKQAPRVSPPQPAPRPSQEPKPVTQSPREVNPAPAKPPGSTCQDGARETGK